MRDKIEDLAKLLDVPAWLVKESLGIPLEECSALTLEQAKVAYIDADKGNEEERAAWLKLEALLKVALKTDKIEELVEIYSLAKEYKIHDVEIDALHRWDDLSAEEVAEAQIDEELKKAFERTPKDSGSRRAAIEKKSQWALKDLNEAITLEDCIEAGKRAPKDSDTKRYIIKKIYDSFFKNKTLG